MQYILKRVQKARVQLDKSVSVAQRCLATMGIDCPVMRIFCTPNLKRSFLSKVTIRDKVSLPSHAYLLHPQLEMLSKVTVRDKVSLSNHAYLLHLQLEMLSKVTVRDKVSLPNHVPLLHPNLKRSAKSLSETR